MSESENVQPPSLEERVVAAAKEQGWREGGELDAFEFVNRGSQFHKALKRQNDELQSVNRKVAEYINSQKLKDHKAEAQQTEAQLRQAAAEGDQETVVKLAQKLQAPPPVIDDPNLEVIAKWESENKDWLEIPEMKADVRGFYTSEMIKLGMNQTNEDPAKILPKVRARIEKEYPDYFKPKNENRELPSGETGGKVRLGKKDGLSPDDLDEDEGKHFKQFVAMGMKPENLLKSIAEQRKNRR